MAKASWLQTDKTIVNPYMGKGCFIAVSSRPESVTRSGTNRSRVLESGLCRKHQEAGSFFWVHSHIPPVYCFKMSEVKSILQRISKQEMMQTIGLQHYD